MVYRKHLEKIEGCMLIMKQRKVEFLGLKKQRFVSAWKMKTLNMKSDVILLLSMICLMACNESQPNKSRVAHNKLFVN